MSKNTTKAVEETRQLKQPKTVQVMVALPWIIIYTMFILIASFITGWHIHDNYVQGIEAKANMKADAIVTSLKAAK